MAELYLRARLTVERGYRGPLTLAALSRALAVSPRQLERAFDEIGLTTFSAHLRAVRLRNAAELLAHQPLTVIDVARLVGYRQPSHFVKAFRRHYGLTPGAFRDRVANSRRDGGDAPANHASPRAGRRRYSNPNSADVSRPDDAGLAPEELVAGLGDPPELAARADGRGDVARGAGPWPAPAASKPNSPLA